MTTGMLFEFEGLDERTYDRINDTLNLYNDPPKGLLLHSGGPIPGGWRVFDIWESKELFEQFLNTRLQKAFTKVGLTRPPKRQDSFPIHNAYAPQPNLVARLTAAGATR